MQSVLAVAGAGLFAVAAIVFTFFNPDLKDHVLRSVIVGGVTLVFLGGAWALARRKLQFSAEAVGALGMVFVALDVYAVSELAQPPVSPWVFTAIGTLVSAIVMMPWSQRSPASGAGCCSPWSGWPSFRRCSDTPVEPRGRRCSGTWGSDSRCSCCTRACADWRRVSTAS